MLQALTAARSASLLLGLLSACVAAGSAAHGALRPGGIALHCGVSQ